MDNFVWPIFKHTYFSSVSSYLLLFHSNECFILTIRLLSSSISVWFHFIILVFCSYFLFCCCWLSHIWLFLTPRTAAHQASLSFTITWSLLKLLSIESVVPSNHLICHCPILLLPSVFPSIRVFSNESALHIRWPKYWSFNFTIIPSNEYSGLISFRIDWFDLFAIQETLKSLVCDLSYFPLAFCVFFLNYLFYFTIFLTFIIFF